MQYNKHYTIFKETSKLYLEYKEDLPPFNNLYMENEADLNYTAYHKKFFPEIKKMFLEEYFNFVNQDYFLGCSFKVYQSNYASRLYNFKESYFDTAEIDFIKQELDTGIFKTKIDIFVTDKNVSKQIEFSLKRRFEYLQSRARANSYNLIFNQIDNAISKKEKFSLELIEQPLEPKKEDVLIDYSDSTPKQKLIALNELGIIKFLRDTEPFNENISKMSEALSLITGIKADNLRSSITPMMQENNIQRNNPYNNKNNVSEVVKKLIEIKK